MTRPDLPADLTLSAAQEALLARATHFAQQRLGPDAARFDAEGCAGGHPYPAETLRALGQEGLFAINLPTTYGGLAAGAVGYVLAVRQLASACAGTTVGLMVSNMVGEAIHAHGDEAQRVRWLPKLARGEYGTAAFSLSEPGAGSDAGGLQSTAQRDGDRYVLNGTKSWVTSGGHAGLYLIMASSDPAARARGISAFVLPADTPGLRAGAPEHKLGQHTSTTTQIILEACAVNLDQRLGAEGQGFKIAMSSLDGGRIGVSAQATGIAQAALDEWRRSGRTEGAHSEAFAQSEAQLSAAWRLCLRAAWLKDQGKRVTQQAAMAKLYCSEAAGQICERALRALGDHPASAAVQRRLREARITRIYEGTNEIQRLVIARGLLKAG